MCAANKKFVDVFGQLPLTSGIFDHFHGACVERVDLHDESKTLYIFLRNTEPADKVILSSLQDQILSCVPLLKNVEINIGSQGRNFPSTWPNPTPYNGQDGVTHRRHRKLKIKRGFKAERRPLSGEFKPDEDVCVEGMIYNVNKRDLRKNRVLVTFDICAEAPGTPACYSAMTVKCFTTLEQYNAECAKLFQKSTNLALKGYTQFDEYAGEVVIMAHTLARAKPPAIREDNAAVKRVELHLHTQMSSLDGMTPAKAFVRRAQAWGHTAIAITDHGVAQAFPEAMEAARNTQVKVLYGIEAYMVNDDTADEEASNEKGRTARSYHAVIFASGKAGLRNLYELISLSHIQYYRRRPRIPRSEFLRLREGLVIGSACESGELFHAVKEGRPDDELERIAEFYDYLEIQPISNNAFMVRAGEVHSEQGLMTFNKRIVGLGERMKKPVVATCDVHFIDPIDEVFRRIIMTGDGFGDADLQAPLYYRTTEEMLSEFAYLGEEKAYEVVVTNTNLIADMIGEIKPIPDGTFPPILEGAEETLKAMVYGNAHIIYGDPLPEMVEQRIKRELTSIIKNRFAVMYVAAQILVSQSEAEGYLVGSRGSVGSSLVATMSGITEVNPLPPHYICPSCRHSDFSSETVKAYADSCGVDMPDCDCPRCGFMMRKEGHNIPFETFLGFDGDKEPDIDLNFSGEYQAKAHAHAETLFGDGQVFKAGTIATIADKTAYGYVKKYFESKGVSVRKAEINRLVMGCTGIKRTTGQHPGGLMIVPKGRSIYEFCPVQRPGGLGDAKVKTDVVTTHFDYHSISGRLLKLDILGHDVPTIIRLLHDITAIDPRTVPLDDKLVLSLFTKPDALYKNAKPLHGYEPPATGSLGLPEFGTGFVRQMLVETKPATFSDLVRISGLSHGTNVWTNNAQDLIRNNTATLKEVITIRDDIMLYLLRMGLEKKTAFKITELVRSKNKSISESDEGIMSNAGIPDWYIDSCKKIEYMFPKGHAVAYVTMTVRIGWFKVFKPEAFYAAAYSVKAFDINYAVMCRGFKTAQEAYTQLIHEMEGKKEHSDKKEKDSARDKNTLSILELILEMYSRGIEFAPLDVYRSDVDRFMSLDANGGATGRILPPLCTVQGLGVSVANNIVAARRDGPFQTVEEFKKRTKVNKTVLAVLRDNGIFEGLPETNQLSFF